VPIFTILRTIQDTPPGGCAHTLNASP